MIFRRALLHSEQLRVFFFFVCPHVLNLTHVVFQRTVSFVWRPMKTRRRSHRPGSPINTPPGVAVSGKSELQRKTSYLSASRSSTSRTTVPMTLCPSMILWAQTILRPSQSKWPENMKTIYQYWFFSRMFALLERATLLTPGAPLVGLI